MFPHSWSTSNGLAKRSRSQSRKKEEEEEEEEGKKDESFVFEVVCG